MRVQCIFFLPREDRTAMIFKPQRAHTRTQHNGLSPLRNKCLMCSCIFCGPLVRQPKRDKTDSCNSYVVSSHLWFSRSLSASFSFLYTDCLTWMFRYCTHYVFKERHFLHCLRWKKCISMKTACGVESFRGDRYGSFIWQL